ncbi:MAG: DUF3108 domain-containing protein [Prevotellaceae bacterium]|jgi:hypothetical protein|nr:DUF3108 domain-containing protein [Prevotellaceae bacterium]
MTKKTLKKISICAFIVGMPLLVSAQTFQFSDREKLSYVASYSLGFIYTEVGDVTIQLEELAALGQYRVRGNGKTRKFYDKVFRVRDYYETRFEVAPFRSLFFHRNIDEGGYRMKNTYHFNWADKTVRGQMQQRQDSVKPYYLAMKNGRNYSDVFTCFYNFRNQNFTNIQNGKTFSFYFILDNEFYSIQCVYIGKEVRRNKKLDAKINCLKFSFEVVAGEVFTGKEKITVWISDDDNHVPVEFEFPIRIGRMRAYLQSYENLQCPLNILETQK